MHNYTYFKKNYPFINIESSAIKLPEYAVESSERFRFNLDEKELEVHCVTCGNWYKIASLKGSRWRNIYSEKEICVTKKNIVKSRCINCIKTESKDIGVWFINKLMTGEFREVKDVNNIKSNEDYSIDKNDIELWKKVKLSLGNRVNELKYGNKYNSQDETYKTICPNIIGGKRVEVLNVLEQSDAALVSYILSFRDQDFSINKIIKIYFSDFVKSDEMEKNENVYKDIEHELLRIGGMQSRGLIKNRGRYEDGTIRINYFQNIDICTNEVGEKYACITVGDRLHQLATNNWTTK